MSDEQRQAFLFEADVSRETEERFDIYARLIQKWNPAINLVAPNTLPDLWDRHFRDSLSVWNAGAVSSGSWLDMGTGGGFPGVVIAILAAEKAPALQINCVEIDIRKATFLRNVSRETGVSFGVHTKRVEMLPPQKADIISARALSSLDTLLGYAHMHLKPTGVAILPKGARHQDEIDAALANWSFALDKQPSLTDPASAVLVIKEIQRV